MDTLLRFFQNSVSEGRRPDALRPLRILLGAVGLILLGCLYVDGPTWFLEKMLWIFATIVALYLAAYFYFVWFNPDFLRSEKFALSKFAIKEVSLGDSNIGMLDLSDLLKVERRSIQQDKSGDQS